MRPRGSGWPGRSSSSAPAPRPPSRSIWSSPLRPSAAISTTSSAEGAVQAREPRSTVPWSWPTGEGVRPHRDRTRPLRPAVRRPGRGRAPFLAETGGDEAVMDSHVAGWPAGGHVTARSWRSARSPTASEALAEALTQDGYAASVRKAPVGDQLCQQHCPVAHVAHEFPQLCEAETEVFGRLLGRHVQRLATIAHGDGVCTTCIPTSATSISLTKRPASSLSTSREVSS